MGQKPLIKRINTSREKMEKSGCRSNPEFGAAGVAAPLVIYSAMKT